MYCFSRTVRFLNSIVKHKFCMERKIVAVFDVPHFQNIVRFSDEVKNKSLQSPLGNLLVKDAAEKKLTDQNSEHEEEDKQKRREKTWKRTKLTLLAMGGSTLCFGAYLIVILGRPEKDENGQPIQDEYSDMPIWKQYFLRTYRELDYYKRLIKEPSRMKLLPDPVQYPYIQPKYTLVLELTDVLCHADWTYKTGWRFKKRPGLDFLLETLHPYYEIVVYTAETGMTVFPLLDAMDPKHYISYRLVRDATHFVDGHHVKSLDNLNRDLSKVIVIDWNSNRVKFHPDNLFNIKKWDGNDDDASLIDLALFLKTIADNDIEDVREVLKHYSKFEDPIIAFRENQRKYMELLEAEAVAQKEAEKLSVKKYTPSFLRRQ